MTSTSRKIFSAESRKARTGNHYFNTLGNLMAEPALSR
jgi:hypothetical protein